MRYAIPIILLFVACESSPPTEGIEPVIAEVPLETYKPTDPPPARPNPPRFFSWVDADLAGMAWPGSGAALDESLRWLREQSVDLVITLTENELDPTPIKANGLKTLHIPIVDFTPPTLAQMDQFVAAVRAAIAQGDRVVAHDAGGKGRLGTMFAAWFVAHGATAQQAIDKIRSMRPGSIETDAQEAIIHTFADALTAR